jgi:hypothetical protein
MTCTSIVLATALAGFPVGTCVLQCELRNAWVGITSSDGREGQIRDKFGWFEVRDIGDRRWVWVVEQEPTMCLDRRDGGRLAPVGQIGGS